MTSIAELGLAVNSESVVKATGDLDSFVDSGARAENAAERVSTALDKSAQKSSSSTKKATAATNEQREALERLLGQIDPTVGALGRLDQMQEKLTRFKAAGILPADDFADYTAKINRARSDLSRFDEGLTRTGNTAKQNAAALRMLPAQFSDIIISLQGGQAPLTVFMQQGAQIKDSFGGAGAAVKAMGGYVTGMISPVTLGAAALAALGIVYIDAEREASAFNKSLFAGTASSGQTAASLAELSRSVFSVTGDMSEAREAVMALAGAAKLSQTQFINLAQASASIADFTGTSAAEVAKALGDIGGSATKAAEKISSQYGLLTSAQYEVISALDEQGKKQEALDALSGYLNENAQKRLVAYKGSLSDVEQGWNSIGTAISNAYSKVKAELFPDLGKRAEIIERILKTREEGGLAGALSTGLSKANTFLGLADGDNDDSTEALQKRLTILKERVALGRQEANIQGETARAEQAKIEATGKWNADQKASLTGLAKLEDDINEKRKLGVAAGRTQAEIEKEVTALRDKYNKSQPKGKVGSGDLSAYNDSQNALKALVAGYDNSFKELDALQRAGLISQEQYSSQSAVLIRAEKEEVAAAYQSEITALEAAQGKKGTTAAQSLQLDQKIADARATMVKALEGFDSQLNILAVNEQGRLKKQALALDAYVAALNEQIDAVKRQHAAEIAGAGMGDEARKRLQEDIKIQQEYQKQIEKLARDFTNSDQSPERKKILDDQTAALKTALGERLAEQQKYYREVDAAQSNWLNGATSAFASYAEEAQNVAGMTKSAFLNAFDGLEDVLVSFVTNGKASFKDFVDSILADIARIVLKTQVIGPLLSTLGISSSPSGSGTGGVFSSLTGGGGGMSVTSMISGAKTVIDVATSKFAESVMTGWAGGNGIVGGIQGAFEGGASYVGSAITSAFSSGSSSAAASMAAGATQAGYAGLGQAASAGSTAAGYGATAGAMDSAAASASTLSSSLGALSTALSVIGTAYSIFTSFQDYGVEGGLTTAGFAAAGAAIGTYVFPVIGTAVGAAIGAALGAVGAAKWFGGPNYEQLVSSAEGSYSGGKFTDEGWYDGWKENKTRLGAGTDGQLMSYVQQFTSTVGMLYDALGDGADVSAALTMRRRETSGDWSNGMAATLDSGEQITALRQYGLTAEENLKEYYDDVMGTFLAQAIVKSESLPAYFKAQFTQFADDWDVTADTVIAAIEGVFTRFNGVNSALSQINVANLKLNETGLIASDSILNMVASLADLDAESATAKEKVDALNELVNGYYSAFFTADEQFADLTKSLTGSFSGLGLELPDTREAYRAMVEDIDVTTAAGQAMFATMMGLATAADSYYSTITSKAAEAKQAALDAAQAIKDALIGAASVSSSAVSRAVESARDQATKTYNALSTSLNDMASTASKSVSDLTSVSSSLESALKSLNGTSDDAVKTLRAQAQATLQSALATARAGGSLSGFDGLEDALDTVSSNNTDLYSSMEDFARDQGRTANVVAELNALNGKQLTSAEKSLAGLEKQIDLAKAAHDAQIAEFDAQLAFAQAQMDALNGVDNSVKTVADAVREMNAAVVAAIATINGKSTATNSGTLIDSIYQDVLGRDSDAAGKQYWQDQLASGSLNNGNIAGAITNAAAADAIKAAYKDILGSAADADGAAYWASQVSSGALTVSQLEQAIKNAAVANGSIPAYATGGLLSGPGTGTSDSMVIRASSGEYVISADAVKAYGTDLLDQINSSSLQVGSSSPSLNVTAPLRSVSGSSQGSSTQGGDIATLIAEFREYRRENQANFEYVGSQLKATAESTDQMANGGMQINGVVETKAVAV
ncbi:phage tail tape measure protein [Pseudomonas caspiana]